MGTMRDMAHSADQINWGARKRVEELSQRPASPEYMRRHNKRVGDFATAVFCLGMAALLCVTWIFWL